MNTMSRSVIVMALANSFALMTAAAEEGATTSSIPRLSTTTPVTQNRDKATYDWMTRHKQILEYIKGRKPDVVFFGDSITHYWGGEPKAPHAWGAEEWKKHFGAWQTINMGFGWDRTENVLWRIENGELGGIEPKVAVVLIGTNNLDLNSAEDIAWGIEAVCRAIHEKTPKTKILLLGILPRLEQNKKGRADLDKINALLESRLHGSPYVTLRDFGKSLRDADGKPIKDLFKDEVHLNAKGYDIIGGKIEEQLKAMIHD
ncbi:MAG: GDSL-type esterase/lipase family protein [Candidatus Sumerlaeota bacterium]|nr:GDSL-type esterase/lipase family protein [Candidatus Sumerlaeota bacterium]